MGTTLKNFVSRTLKKKEEEEEPNLKKTVSQFYTCQMVNKYGTLH